MAFRSPRFTINIFQLRGHTTPLFIRPSGRSLFLRVPTLNDSTRIEWSIENSSPRIRKWNSGMTLKVTSHMTRLTTSRYLTAGSYSSRPTLHTGDSTISSELWIIGDQQLNPEGDGILRLGETRTGLSLKHSNILLMMTEKRLTQLTHTTIIMQITQIITATIMITNLRPFVRWIDSNQGVTY